MEIIPSCAINERYLCIAKGRKKRGGGGSMTRPLGQGDKVLGQRERGGRGI